MSTARQTAAGSVCVVNLGADLILDAPFQSAPVGCSATFTQGSRVTLVFTPRAGSVFTSQSGCDQFNPDGISGTHDCHVDLTAARTVTVLFSPPVAEVRWREMGAGVASMNGGIQARSVVLDSQGRAVVAYRGGDTLIYVSRWNGTAWTPVGGALNTVPSITGSPSLDLDASGQPVVAWVEGDRVIVKRWAAGVWTNYGSDDGPPNGDGAALPSLALGPDGTPFVAWAQYAIFPGEGIRVAHGNSTGWTVLGSFVNPPQFTDLRTLPYMQLAVGADAAPVIAYSGYATGVGVEVRKWNGLAWNLLGGVAVDSDPSSRVSVVALDVADGSDQPLVAWYDRTASNVRVRRFASGAWTSVGDGQMTPGADLNALGLADGAEPAVIYPISNFGSGILRGYRYGPP